MLLKIVLAMAVSLVSESATVSGSSSLTPAYPSGSATGDFFVLCISGRANAATPPSASGFSAANGDNFLRSGEAIACVLVREANGSESGTVSVTATDWTSTQAKILLFRNATGVWNSHECVQGGDFIASDDYLASLNNFDPPDMAAGDFYVAVTGIDQQVLVGPPATTNHVLTASGLTFGSADIRESAGISEGDGSTTVITVHQATSGSSTTAPTYSFDLDSINGDGATVLIRIREGEGAPPESAKDWLHYFRQYSGGAA